MVSSEASHRLMIKVAEMRATFEHVTQQARKIFLSVRETEILVEQQPPQGVFVCDHAGLVIKKSLSMCAQVETEAAYQDRLRSKLSLYAVVVSAANDLVSPTFFVQSTYRVQCIYVHGRHGI